MRVKKEERRLEEAFDEAVEHKDWEMVCKISAALDRTRERLMKLVGYPRQPAATPTTRFEGSRIASAEIVLDSNLAPTEPESSDSPASS